MSKLATVILDLIARVDQATKPRNPELEYGDETTVAATRDVRGDHATPIKIVTD